MKINELPKGMQSRFEKDTDGEVILHQCRPATQKELQSIFGDETSVGFALVWREANIPHEFSHGNHTKDGKGINSFRLEETWKEWSVYERTYRPGFFGDNSPRQNDFQVFRRRPPQHVVTFNHLAQKCRIDGWDRVRSRGLIYETCARAMAQANRTYQRDKFNPSDEGNYLDDFLARHGEELLKPIVFHPGTAYSVGVGIQFIDVEKLRRQCRDALNKTASQEDIMQIADILRIK